MSAEASTRFQFYRCLWDRRTLLERFSTEKLYRSCSKASIPPVTLSPFPRSNSLFSDTVPWRGRHGGARCKFFYKVFEYINFFLTTYRSSRTEILWTKEYFILLLFIFFCLLIHNLKIYALEKDIRHSSGTWRRTPKRARGLKHIFQLTYPLDWVRAQGVRSFCPALPLTLLLHLRIGEDQLWRDLSFAVWRFRPDVKSSSVCSTIRTPNVIALVTIRNWCMHRKTRSLRGTRTEFYDECLRFAIKSSGRGGQKKYGISLAVVGRGKGRGRQLVHGIC